MSRQRTSCSRRRASCSPKRRLSCSPIRRTTSPCGTSTSPHHRPRRFSLETLGVDSRNTPDSMPPGWLVFSPDESHLYAGGAGPTVAFDVGTGERVRSFDSGGGLAVESGRRLDCCPTGATTVGVFDTADGRLRAELVGHDAQVMGAAFSPDDAWGGDREQRRDGCRLECDNGSACTPAGGPRRHRRGSRLQHRRE